MIGPDCHDVAYLLSRARESRLTRRERWAVRMHLLICVYCRRYARQLRWLEQALARVRGSGRTGRLDEEARARIRARLDTREETRPNPPADR